MRQSELIKPRHSEDVVTSKRPAESTDVITDHGLTLNSRSSFSTCLSSSCSTSCTSSTELFFWSTRCINISLLVRSTDPSGFSCSRISSILTIQPLTLLSILWNGDREAKKPVSETSNLLANNARVCRPTVRRPSRRNHLLSEAVDVISDFGGPLP